MKKEEYKKMFFLEKNNWWFKGKRHIIFNFVDKFYKNKNNLKILDVGCGTGIILKRFEKYGQVYGTDISEDAINFCKKRNLKNVQVGDANKLQYSSNSFDIISINDVLYHKGIKDDVAVLKELFRVCKKGGRIFITDSAMKCLWSKHDLAVHARTRYSKEEFNKKLIKSGFKVQKISYFNFFLFPLVFFVRRINNITKRKPSTDIEKTIEPFNTILYSIFVLESYLLKIINFPAGVSIFIVAKK
jgi:ubiquinone/menaquinone biosynthesis C-methylase UbiE